jgi:hypothetical protein
MRPRLTHADVLTVCDVIEALLFRQTEAPAKVRHRFVCDQVLELVGTSPVTSGTVFRQLNLTQDEQQWVTYETVRRILAKQARQGQITRLGYGVYCRRAA